MKLSKKQVILALFTSLLVILAVLAFYFYKKKSATLESQQETSKVNTVNYDPPTDEEKNAGDSKKSEIVNNSENSNSAVENTDNSSSQTPNANVIIVDAGQYDQSVEIRAFVSNVVKDGTCTYTLKNGNKTIVRDIPAYADATTTPCINLTLARSDLPVAGSWDVEVKYTSDGYYGSARTSMEIQ